MVALMPGKMAKGRFTRYVSMSIAATDKTKHTRITYFWFFLNKELNMVLHQNKAHKNQMAPIIGTLAKNLDVCLNEPFAYNEAIIQRDTLSSPSNKE